MSDTEKLRERIKERVDWQFKGIHNLLPSAYGDSLNIIASQILKDCKESGLKFVPKEWKLPVPPYPQNIEAINSQIKEIGDGD